jgi:hypothetical protein
MDFPEGSNMKAPRGFRVSLWSLFDFIFIFHNNSQKGGFHMRKIIFLLWIFLLFPSITWAQEKVDVPVWNVGDKWTFTGDGSIEVVKADQIGYVLKYSAKKCSFESQGCKAIMFDKSTRNRIFFVDGDKRKKYGDGLSKVLEFPLIAEKQWKSVYSATGPGAMHSVSYDFSEIYKVSGWEDIPVQAGKFKALRLEYKRVVTGVSGWGLMGVGDEIKNQYWYSPDVKYFVKCQYDKEWMKGNKEIFNWELASFQLKK